MIIIGHRGAKGLAPENTISSLQKAISLGVDMVEIDLRLDMNGQIVLSHDPDPTKEYRGAANLADALGTITVPVNFEIKEPGFESELLKIIKGFPLEVLISSFKFKILKKIRTLDRDIKLGSIIGPGWNNYFYWILVIGRYLKIHSIHPHYSLVTKRKVWWMHKLGFKVFSWVVNDQPELERVKNLGVDGVFTDYPDRIKRNF